MTWLVNTTIYIIPKLKRSFLTQIKAHIFDSNKENDRKDFKFKDIDGTGVDSLDFDVVDVDAIKLDFDKSKNALSDLRS